MKKAGLANRNIVHLQKIILRCVGFCSSIFLINNDRFLSCAFELILSDLDVTN